MMGSAARLVGPLLPIALAAGVVACSAAAPDQSAAQATEQGKAQARGPRAVLVVASGCFWCTESDFDKVPGVLVTVSGYTGGKLRNPTYEQVSAGNTGHIEAVRIVYNPQRVSYERLITHLLRTSDPVDAGGQFCDRGYQYRSAIFVADARERQVARNVIARLTPLKKVPGPIATLVLPRAPFYAAEGYHQDYYKKNPIRYRYYRSSCGRDARVKKAWGG